MIQFDIIMPSTIQARLDEPSQKALEKLVKEEMEGVFKLEVPLEVEVCTGANWRDME